MNCERIVKNCITRTSIQIIQYGSNQIQDGRWSSIFISPSAPSGTYWSSGWTSLGPATLSSCHRVPLRLLALFSSPYIYPPACFLNINHVNQMKYVTYIILCVPTWIERAWKSGRSQWSQMRRSPRSPPGAEKASMRVKLLRFHSTYIMTHSGV